MHAGFGLGRLHHLFSKKEREAVVHSAIDAGFRHFDLAPAYGDGLAERELGRILVGKRTSVRIATKFGIPFHAIGELPLPIYLALRAAGKATSTSFGANYNRRDFRPAVLASSLDNSLRRLRTDYLDYLLVHEPRTIDDFRSLGDTWTELERQQRRGKIRSFGVSSEIRPLLDAEREALVPAAAIRMVPMSETTCGLPRSWFHDREVLVFNLVKYLGTKHGPGRIETRVLVESVARSLPECRAIFASNNIEEIRRLGAAIAEAAHGQGERGLAS